MNKYKKKSLEVKKNAEKWIIRLFELAEKFFKKEPKLSNRYIQLARKISMKYKVKIPKEFKRRFCKKCYSYLYPGINCRVRLCQSKVVYYCLNCKNFMRFPIKK
ncbi:MAG: ribonuclease P protein component 4 [Candidatus Woesearchaeota archaeon]